MGNKRHRERASLLVLGSVALCISVSPLEAQTPPAGKPATPPEVMEPPSENQTPPVDPNDGSKPKEPLSKELREGEGVLEPPKGVDPGIEKGVPEDFKGTMPVIPPPGEPGGNQDVHPK
ncbi:hypothetical protein [Hyphomicrobium sp.]|uniref:hypothetical protein n=1 Tax=Hyphomicrobium sp. TaxID=82 RepID=UPI002E341015|nr:hypothetical protein [Hyphomicrobium sp.]HEX2841816.1 hypothetical protein [Hyphomicrobium sp.]